MRFVNEFWLFELSDPLRAHTGDTNGYKTLYVYTLASKQLVTSLNTQLPRMLSANWLIYVTERGRYMSSTQMSQFIYYLD